MTARLLPILLAALVTTVALGTSAAHAQDATVTVVLTDWTVAPNVSSVTEGNIEFAARNVGGTAHQLTVVRTDFAPNALPLASNRIDRSAAGVEVAGETPELASGGTQSATFTLVPGHYILICDIPGHYQLGMRAAFSVTAGTAAGTSTPAAGATSTTQANAPPAAGSGGPASTADRGVPALVLELAALGATLLVAGGSWAIVNSRRSIR